jgi:uncharacterized membrane protein YfcA
MSPGELLQTIGAALVIGALIGGIGVGGVLLVPWLTQVIGLPIHLALGIAMLAFTLPGAVVLVMAGRSDWRATPAEWRLVLATVPGALAGSAVLPFLAERALFAILALAVSVVGLRLILANGSDGPSTVATKALAVGTPTGLATGFLSAITGTGGPMVLTPWLLWRGTPLLGAVVLGQFVQLPIAATATAGNLLAGSVDIVAGLSIGAMLVPGVFAGQRIARLLPRRLLGLTVGWTLFAAAGAFLMKAL